MVATVGIRIEIQLWGGGGANPKKDEKRLCQFWDFIRGDRLFFDLNFIWV